MPLLRVGMDPRAGPWAFVPGLDYSHEDVHKPPLLTPAQLAGLEGLDVDVLRALARRMRVRTEIVPTLWEDLETSLLARRFDLILSAWTPSPRTSPSIRASLPYYEWGLLIVVRSDDQRIRSYRDLEGLRVGRFSDPAVERGTNAMGHGLGIQFTEIDAGDRMLQALRTGAVDAILYDSLFIRWRLARDPAFRIVGEPLNRLGYNVGVRADDGALFDQVQRALKDLLASPEIGEIRERWEKPAH
jgi:glutamine transport system substrate-binding protein